MQRRSFLARVTAAAATPVVTGCLGGPGSPSGTPTAARTPTPTPTPTPTATPTATPTPTARPGPDAVVRLQSNDANPPFAGIGAGGTVEWVNDDPYPHELVAAQFHEHAEDWEWGPHELSSGASITHTFEERGQYEYYGVGAGRDVLCGAVTVDVALGKGLPCE